MIAVNAISGGIRRIGMARKNNMKPDNASSIHFDTRTKAVMAQVNSEDKVNVKEKVSAVREVVPGKSANEIVLVLQYYDYNVERAIQAYLEDGAKEALTEWHFTGNKVPNKKKKNKKNKSSGAQSGATASASASATASASASLSSAPTQASDKPAVLNHTKEPLANGDIHEDEELLRVRARLLDGDTSHTPPSSSTLKPKPTSTPKQSSTPTTKAAPTPPPQAAAASADKSTSRGGGGEAPHHHNRQHHNKHSDKHSGPHHHGHHDHQRQRTISERSTSSVTSEGVKKPFAGLEKSTKDLQRQTISLERLRLGLDAEIEKAYKRIKTVFDEARDNLMDREVQLMREMDALKVQAHEVFQMRHDKAGELKVQVDRSEKLNPSELAELRADIKLFVSDRKIDEDLCKTTRFTYDSDHFFEEIKKFGTVVPVKCPYNTRRPSVSSVASSGHGQEDPVSPSRLKKHTPNLSMHSDVKPVGDNSNLSVSEMAELNQRLKNSLQLQKPPTKKGLPVKSPPQRNRPASAPAQKPEGEQREGDFRKNRSGRRRRGPRENSQGENASNPAENHNTTSNTAQSGRQSSSPEKKANSRSPRRNYSGNQSSPRRYGSAGSGGRGQRSEGHDEESGYRGDGQRPRGRGEGRGRGGRGRDGRGRGQGRGGRGGGHSNPPPQSSPDGSTSVNHVVNGSTKGPE